MSRNVVLYQAKPAPRKRTARTAMVLARVAPSRSRGSALTRASRSPRSKLAKRTVRQCRQVEKRVVGYTPVLSTSAARPGLPTLAASIGRYFVQVHIRGNANGLPITKNAFVPLRSPSRAAAFLRRNQTIPEINVMFFRGAGVTPEALQLFQQQVQGMVQTTATTAYVPSRASEVPLPPLPNRKRDSLTPLEIGKKRLRLE